METWKEISKILGEFITNSGCIKAFIYTNKSVLCKNMNHLVKCLTNNNTVKTNSILKLPSW